MSVRLGLPAAAPFWDRLYYYIFEADYLSDVNRYLPWRYALGCLLMAAVAAGLCGWFLHEQAFVLLAGIVVAIVLGLLWPALSVLGIRGQLRFDQERVREGQRVGVNLTLRNAWPLGIWGLRVCGGFDRFSGQEGACIASLAVAPGWRSTEFRWELTAVCRGEYPVGPVRLKTGFPFGLWEAGRRLQAAQRLRVWPRTFPLFLLPEAMANDRTKEGLTPIQQVGTQGDVLGVRPYRQGDPLRRVHWKQSARHDRLIVCEQQAMACPRVQIVLDLHPESHAGQGPDSSREWAIRIAASIAEAALTQGGLVELVLNDAVVPPAAGTMQQQRILDTLACVGEEAVRSLGEVLAEPICQPSGGLQLILTTGRGMSRLAEPGMARRGRYWVLLAQDAFCRHKTLLGKTGAAGRDEPDRDAAAEGGGRVFWITNPEQVVQQMQAIWKELLCAS
jgi:uncharacterized protein (DUF58 family)